MGLDRLEKTALAVWLGSIAVGILFWIGVIYVAVHFVLKFW